MEKKSVPTNATNSSNETNTTDPRLSLQRLFIKQSSFDARKSHSILKQKWVPEGNIELKVNHAALDEENSFEVTLHLTFSMQSNKRLAYVAEITQAGIFEIANFEKAQQEQLLNAYCPTMLYPFLREALSHMVTQGGFPQMLLAPINFDAMYAQQLAQQKTEAEKKEQVVINNVSDVAH